MQQYKINFIKAAQYILFFFLGNAMLNALAGALAVAATKQSIPPRPVIFYFEMVTVLLCVSIYFFVKNKRTKPKVNRHRKTK